MIRNVWIGIDPSTSCSGLAVIDENEKIIFADYCFTKKEVQKAESLGEKYDILINAFSDLIIRFRTQPELIEDEIIIKGIGIEANSFGGFNTTMLLGVCLGIWQTLLRRSFSSKNTKFDYVAVGNWRNHLLNDKEINLDVTDNAQRAELKRLTADFVEKKFEIKLPLFENKSDGEKQPNGDYDMRVNDVSDAIGIALMIKRGLAQDRVQFKVETKRQNREVATLKSNVQRYKKLVDTWYKSWKKDKSVNNLRTLKQHIGTLKWYLNALKDRKLLLDRHLKYFAIIEEIEQVFLTN